MKNVAKRVAAQGRRGDTEIVHMNKDEVRALHGIASLAGRKLTRNPKTGAVEAFNLFDVLPLILNFIPGIGTVASIALSAASGAASAAVEGNDPLTGGIMGGVMGGLSGSLFGGGAEAAQAAATAAPTALTGAGQAVSAALPQAATAAASGLGSAATSLAPQIAWDSAAQAAKGVGQAAAGLGQQAAQAAPGFLTDVAGAGSDKAVGDFFGRLTSKANLPYTLAGGAALASLMPGENIKGPGPQEVHKPRPPSAPRAYAPAPAGYLPGFDPEWNSFTPNPGPYFQGDPNYKPYAGGGHVGPSAPVNTNKAMNNRATDHSGDPYFEQFMRDLDARARARATPEQMAKDQAERDAWDAEKARGDAIMQQIDGQQAKPLHRWTGAPETNDPVSGGPWSGGVPSNTVHMPIDMPRIMQQLAAQPVPPFVQGGAPMPQEDMQQRMGQMFEQPQAPAAPDQEAFFQDKINMMHAHQKAWRHNPVDRQKYDWYVNMRDLERSKKSGRQMSSRFDPSQTTGLDQSRYSDGGIVGYARGGRPDGMRSNTPSFPTQPMQGAWWRGEGTAPPIPMPQVPASGKAGGNWGLAAIQSDRDARALAQAMAQHQANSGTNPMLQQSTLPAYTPTPRPPGSYIAGNALVEAPSIQPTLFQPVTAMQPPVQGMARGGGIGCYAGGGKAEILQQLLGGRHIPGRGNGMDDDVPAMIDGREPAALSSGEFVVSADAVSALGDGNTDAGVKRLEEMMARIRMMKTGKAKQPPRINPKRVMPA